MSKKETYRPRPVKIKVIGIGGGGVTILKSIAPKLERVDFIAVNTDSRSLERLGRKIRPFLFGEDITFGLGTGMKPELAERAALEAEERFSKLLKNTDLCLFITCLGGGTGSGATPVFLETARKAKILTLTIATTPFKFEGLIKKKITKEALAKIKKKSNSFAVISNERIFKLMDSRVSFSEALNVINNLLKDNIASLIDLVYNPGLINLDFADLRTILKNHESLIYFQTREFPLSKPIEEIAQELISNPLYEYEIKNAKKILLQIETSDKVPMQKTYLLSQEITRLSPQAKIIFGISLKKRRPERLKVTLLAAGCQEKEEQKEVRKAKAERKEERPKKEAKKSILKKKRKILKEETEKEKKQKPKKIRKTPLEIKRENEKARKKLLLFDDELEIPAFIRRKIKKK